MNGGTGGWFNPCNGQITRLKATPPDGANVDFSGNCYRFEFGFNAARRRRAEREQLGRLTDGRRVGSETKTAEAMIATSMRTSDGRKESTVPFATERNGSKGFRPSRGPPQRFPPQLRQRPESHDGSLASQMRSAVPSFSTRPVICHTLVDINPVSNISKLRSPRPFPRRRPTDNSRRRNQKRKPTDPFCTLFETRTNTMDSARMRVDAAFSSGVGILRDR